MNYSEQQIADVTGMAFQQGDEKLRICLLRALDGVDWPVASAFFYVGLSADYPILDYRALWSLGSGEPNSYTFDFWWCYVECCRRLARESGVSVRDLDKALWAYSEKNQPREQDKPRARRQNDAPARAAAAQALAKRLRRQTGLPNLGQPSPEFVRLKRRSRLPILDLHRRSAVATGSKSTSMAGSSSGNTLAS